MMKSFIKMHLCILAMDENMPPIVLISPRVVSLWPWPLTFWLRNLISSFLSPAALKLYWMFLALF